MKQKWLGASTLVLMFLLSGCAEKEEVKQPKVEEKKEVIEVVNQEDTEVVKEEFKYTFPLTGVGTNEEVAGRAVAVMINNHPSARPQSGIDKADIVFEVLAEGNVTRFLAIFQSEHPEKIGPVRSARDYYIELAKGYDSLYVCHGNSPEAKQMMDSGYVDHLNGLYYDGSLFKRASFRNAPHNSYITYDNILKGAEKNKYNMELLPQSLPFLSDEETNSLEGDSAETVMVSYFSSSLFDVIFEYDKESEKYTRYSNGEVTADLDSKEPVLVDNLFIVEMNHDIIDNYGRRDINLTSGGNAYLIQKGKKTEVQWKNIDGQIIPFNENGPVGLVPGKTWINVIPSQSGLQETVSFNKN